MPFAQNDDPVNNSEFAFILRSFVFISDPVVFISGVSNVSPDERN